MPLFVKGKNEQRSSQGRKDIEKDQRVVTFLDDDSPVMGHVRFIGEHKDRTGNMYTIVGLELVGYFFVQLFLHLTVIGMCISFKSVSAS